MTLTMKQLPYIQMKLRYHSTAHFPYVDNDKDQCETNCETNVPVDDASLIRKMTVVLMSLVAVHVSA